MNNNKLETDDISLPNGCVWRRDGRDVFTGHIVAASGEFVMGNVHRDSARSLAYALNAPVLLRDGSLREALEGWRSAWHLQNGETTPLPGHSFYSAYNKGQAALANSKEVEGSDLALRKASKRALDKLRVYWQGGDMGACLGIIQDLEDALKEGEQS